MPTGAIWIRRAIRSRPLASAVGVIDSSRRVAASRTNSAKAGRPYCGSVADGSTGPPYSARITLARIEARRRAALARGRGGGFGLALAGLLRIVLRLLARAALHEFLAIAPSGLEVGIGLLRVGGH